MADYDICSVIHDLVNMIFMRAQEKGLEFSVSVEADIPSGLRGDDVRLRQILSNLLTNAVKYTNEGSVHLSVSGVRDAEDVILHFEVADTGIGIKKEDIPSGDNEVVVNQMGSSDTLFRSSNQMMLTKAEETESESIAAE